MTDSLKRRTGRRLANFLQKETGSYARFSAMPPHRLRAALEPGDVLLVEGNTRISAAIKYLTNSTWSHAALFVGGGETMELIEADVVEGVRMVPLSVYEGFNTRICRPVGLTPEDRTTVIAHMHQSLGRAYDLRNVVDLARYLLPQPPVPKRFRRKLLSLGSGDPTRAICSTLIAEAFGKVRYPILPERRIDPDMPGAEELLHIRHHSLYTPRDFDLSPYFRIVKPTIESGFDYRRLNWYEEPMPAPQGKQIAPAGSADRAAIRPAASSSP
jgi:hypothetical protein